MLVLPCRSITDDHRCFLKFCQTDLTGFYCILQCIRCHQESAFMAEPGTLKSGCFYQFFSFQSQPFYRKAAFIIQRILFFLRLNTVASAIGRKDHKCNLRLRQAFLTGNKFRKYQDFCSFLAIRQQFFHSLIRPFISLKPFKFMFQNHSRHTDSLEKSFITAALRIPCRIKVSDQSRQFILFSRIVIQIQRLHKRFIKFLRQLFPQDFFSQFFPEQTKGRIGSSVFPYTAVFLMMIIFSSSDVKYDSLIFFRNPVAPGNLNLRIQI